MPEKGFFRKAEGLIGKKPQKELLKKELQGELYPFPNPAKETAEEKNLRTIGIKEDTKRKLAWRADFYETEDGNGGVFKEESNGKAILNERAAYIVDKFFGFELVPATVIRNIGGEEGSFQRFIPDAKTGFKVSRKQVPTKELVKLALFDFLINNTDRDRGNFLLKRKRIYAIDNESSFPIIYSHSTYFKENFFSTPIPEEIRNKIIQFEKWPEGKETLSNSLEKLLGMDKSEAFFSRLEHITQYAKRGYFQTKEEYEKFGEQAEEAYRKKFTKNDKLKKA